MSNQALNSASTEAWTVAEIPDQTGRVAVVTGANSGIGWHTALELARAGATVILTARTTDKGRDAIDRIRRELPAADVRTAVLDLADLASVRAFAGTFAADARIDLLVHNAGVMSVPERRTTTDGFELQLGTNFLGPFALTGLLLPALRRSGAPRVTVVSSGAANMGKRKIDFDDLQSERSYSPWKAYCQSKLADLLFALEMGRRQGGSPRIVTTMGHPGYARTNLQTSGPGKPQGRLALAFERLASQDAAHGALPTLRAATADVPSGTYFGPSGLMQLKGRAVQVPLPKPTLDEAAARRLWTIAEELTGVRW